MDDEGRMPGFTKDEALAFIGATRLAVEGKVGFKWLVDKLSDLASYVESMAAENERLNAYIDAAGAREDYESYRGQLPDAREADASPSE